MKQWQKWLPRVLAVLDILFISVFALDAFEEPNWFWALLTHLIPSFILLVALMIAWKNRWGGIIFVAFGIFFIKTTWIIWLPPVVVGILFLVVDNG